MDLDKTLSCPSGILSIGEGKKLIAFTLAEVLITLGIVGVVAAMTIPNLITAHQKKVTVTKLQKAISVINQAYRMSYDENGETTAQEAMDMGNSAYFEKYWAPYLKLVHICKGNLECGYSSPTPFLRPDLVNSTMGLFNSTNRTAFYTADGMLYIVFVANGPIDDITPSSNIYVDINGGKGPNVFGKDVFVLVRQVDDTKGGSVVCKGHSNSDISVNNDCSKTGSGRLCAEKIRRAGWQIEKDYPW